jgi:uncharacterized protein (TIGR00369 family)
VPDSSEAAPPVPFFVLNALRVIDAGEGRATCSTEVTPWLAGTPEEGIQAGVAALADCLLSYGAATLLSPGLIPVTLSMRLDFCDLPPPLGSCLEGDAEVVPSGGDVLLVQGTIAGPDGLVASGSLRSMLVPPVPERKTPEAPPAPVISTVPPLVGADSVRSSRLEAVLSLDAWKLAGIEDARASDHTIEITLRPAGELERSNGVVHGGAVPVLGQLAAAAAVAVSMPERPGARTLDTTCEYLRPTPVGAPLTVRARVVHRSRRVVMTHVEMTGESGKPMSRVYETLELDPD